MSEKGEKIELAPAWIRDARFWDGVEHEVEELDVHDFAEFLESGEQAIEPRPGFFEGLRERLRAFVRSRYST